MDTRDQSPRIRKAIMALLGVTWCSLRTFRTSGTYAKHDDAAEIGRVLAVRWAKSLLHSPETRQFLAHAVAVKENRVANVKKSNAS